MYSSTCVLITLAIGLEAVYYQFLVVVFTVAAVSHIVHVTA